MEHISYKKQTEIVNFQGREIPLENLTPILTPEEAAEKVDTTAYIWYNIIIKYRRWYHG